MTKKFETELDKAKKNCDEFEKSVEDLKAERNEFSRKEEARSPELSQKDTEKDLYIKPKTWIADNQKFNPKFEKDWEFAKEYVKCIPVHNECRGDLIEFWTHPFGGKGAEFWQVPSDKPVWIPRYAAEQLTKCSYRRLKMDEKQTRSADGTGTYYGQMCVDTITQRLDALPVSNKKSIFMGNAA